MYTMAMATGCTLRRVGVRGTDLLRDQRSQVSSPTTTRSYAWVLALVIVPHFVLAGVSTAQTPLPETLAANFKQITSDFFYYVDPDDGNGAVRVGLQFTNTDERKIVLTYFFKDADPYAIPGELIKEIPVSYHPTAICKKAGKGDTFYVAGWAERLGHTVLEEWKLVGGAVGSTVPPSGPPISALIPPTIEKTLLLSTDEIGPVASVAFNHYGGECWLLEEASPKKVWSVDPASPSSRAVMFDATSDPTGTLATMTSMAVGRHPTAGFMIYFELKRRWVSGTLYHEPYPLRVFRDTDQDGVMDVQETRTFLDLYTTFPPGSWTIKYD